MHHATMSMVAMITSPFMFLAALISCSSTRGSGCAPSCCPPPPTPHPHAHLGVPRSGHRQLVGLVHLALQGAHLTAQRHLLRLDVAQLTQDLQGGPATAAVRKNIKTNQLPPVGLAVN
jgi:hypothetical protein